MVLSVISSFAMWFGLVPVASRSVEWTVPVLASGYLATGSVRGSKLQAFNLIVGTMIYIPFIKQSERVQDREFLGKIKRLEASMGFEMRTCLRLPLQLPSRPSTISRCIRRSNRKQYGFAMAL